MKNPQDFIGIGSALESAAKRIAKHKKSRQKDILIKTGFPELDKALGGGENTIKMQFWGFGPACPACRQAGQAGRRGGGDLP